MPAPRSRKARPRTAGQRAGVTRDAVLDAARALAEREGIDGVSMRRIAAALGVAPNALYSYFPSRTAILDAVLDAVLGELALPAPRADWREALVALMAASRATVLRHPTLVPLFLARPGGPSAMRLGEATLRELARGGITGADAVEAMRALLVYTLGFAAMEVPRLLDPEREARLARARRVIDDAPAGELDATRRVADDIARHPDDASFERGLRWLLAGIATRV